MVSSNLGGFPNTQWEPWFEPFRGSRYSFNRNGIFYIIPITKQRVLANNYSTRLHDSLLGIKPRGGRFRIDENCNIVVIIQDDDGWMFVKVDNYDDSLGFNDVELRPRGPVSGDLWPGFYSNHGARYSLGTLNEIFIPLPRGKRCYVDNPPQVLMDRLRQFMPKGGRFYITEHGHIWCNSRIGPRRKFLKKQVQSFSPLQRELLDNRIESTGLYPVYIGNWTGRFELDLKDYSHQSYNDSDYEYV